MSQRDIVTGLGIDLCIVPKVAKVDADGIPAAALDMQKGDAGGFLLLVGDSGDTLAVGLKHDIIAEDSADGITYAPVTTGSYLVGSFTPDANGIIATIAAPTADQVAIFCGYKGEKRYFRLRDDLTGTHTNGTPIAGVAIYQKRLEGSYATS
jgi:hypothetical protein